MIMPETDDQNSKTKKKSKIKKEQHNFLNLTGVCGAEYFTPLNAKLGCWVTFFNDGSHINKSTAL